MKTYPKYIKYFILLPILFIQFSCEDSTSSGCSGTCNGDLVGSWQLTALTGTYVYTVNLPDDDESGMTWPADTSFGIHMQGEHASVEGVGSYANYIASEVVAGSTIPGVSTTKEFTLAALQASGIGLIGVFEDAPSAGSYATYHMKGDYPSVSYDFTNCATALSTPTMQDQGIYTWDQTLTTENFQIKRDPNIAGTQVLPPFNDGTLAFTDTDLNTLNIQFIDRDSHSSPDTGYGLIPEYVWDEGKHPNLTTQDPKVDSGGDRSYMAFPPVLAVGTMPDGYGDTFIGSYDPTSTTHNTPGTGPAYLYDPALAYWGNYMTWNAWCFLAEMEYRLATQEISDADNDGTAGNELVGYMIEKMMADATGGTDLAKTHGFNISYATLITTDWTSEGTYPTDDSMNDYSDGGGNGRLKYTITGNDCAVPADVTIDFNATFTRCTTDNCAAEDPPYHVVPSWD